MVSPAQGLERRSLGNTGMEVSSFCFGTWELGGLAWGPIVAEDAVALLRDAFDRGVTVYDCSDNYGGGRSEILLSVAFHGRRDQVVYVSKVGTSADWTARSRCACERRSAAGTGITRRSTSAGRASSVCAG